MYVHVFISLFLERGRQRHIYIHIYIYNHIFMYTCMYINTYIYTHIYIYIYIFIHIHTWIYLSMCVYTLCTYKEEESRDEHATYRHTSRHTRDLHAHVKSHSDPIVATAALRTSGTAHVSNKSYMYKYKPTKKVYWLSFAIQVERGSGSGGEALQCRGNGETKVWT